MIRQTFLGVALAGALLAPAAALASVNSAVEAAPVLLTETPIAALPVEMPAMPPVTFGTILPVPTVEAPLKKLFCVEYARARSGLAVFGDAKFWWARAKSLYSRFAAPAENAVMVFSGSSRLSHGHVAVVTHIISKREIRVDQANWENHGEIDHATPVLDVSAKNDWSKVRVWNRQSNDFGKHVYAISGFIAKDLVRQASNS